MRRLPVSGLTILLLALALAVSAPSVRAQLNTVAGTVASIGGPSVTVRMDAGDETTLQVDGVSIDPSRLRTGDRVLVQYHPIDKGSMETVTMTLEPPQASRPEAAVASTGDGPDGDRDGVSDSRDNCPDTPQGCRVDAHGCSIDTDGDGVCDTFDRCPGTAVRTTVGKNGCPLPLDEQHLETELLDTGMIRLANVNFDYDKSDIRPDAYAPLEAVGKVLTTWPGLRIEINAYCDSRGTEDYNYDLSGRRSESVRAYLLSKFPQFTPDQLTAKNYGESNPMVPNTTMANMQLNRRVEFIVLNKEVLRQQR